MSKLLRMLVCLSVVGCAHIDRQQALEATSYDVMTDAEIAQVALAEALGELHEVKAIDAEGVVTEGQAAFASRTERLAYERRVDGLIRQRIYGQGPTLELVRLYCRRLASAGWVAWPGDARERSAACEYGDVSMTVHSLFKKPMLQRAFVEVLLDVSGDSLLRARTQRRLLELERVGVEAYLLMVERWDRVEGFRPRG
jgi:hypothetical protein